MTGRTHDLAAISALNYIFITYQMPHMSLATMVVSIGANALGGLAPDLDQPTDELYRKLPVGSFFGKLIAPFLGGHRHLSHSILGLVLFGFLLGRLLPIVHTVLLVDMNSVWWSFMIGFFSHLVADSLTKEGVPWFFPIPIKLGFPPFSFLRIKTGGVIEKLIVFPGLLLFNGYLFYHFYIKYLEILKHFITR